MLYTLELDTAPGLVDWEQFDPSAFAEELEKGGAQDAVVSADNDGRIGFTAQFEGMRITDAIEQAVEAGGTAYDNYFPIDRVSAYETPVLEETTA